MLRKSRVVLYMWFGCIFTGSVLTTGKKKRVYAEHIALLSLESYTRFIWLAICRHI